MGNTRVIVDGQGRKIDAGFFIAVNEDGTPLAASGGVPASIATEPTLIEIRDAILNKKVVGFNLVIDANDALFVNSLKYDQETDTVSSTILDLDGTVATTNVAPYKQVNKEATSTTTNFEALATGTGYIAGDFLSYTIITRDGSRESSFWYNETAQLAIAIPASGHYEPSTESVNANITQSVLPTGAANELKQDAANLSLTSIDGKLPTLGQAIADNSVSVTLASDQPSIPIVNDNPNTIIAKQVKIAITDTAVALGADSFVNGVVIKAGYNNSSTIFIGKSNVATTDDGTGNGYPLEAGEAISYGASDISDMFINGAADDFVYVTGN